MAAAAASSPAFIAPPAMSPAALMASASRLLSPSASSAASPCLRTALSASPAAAAMPSVALSACWVASASAAMFWSFSLISFPTLFIALAARFRAICRFSACWLFSPYSAFALFSCSAISFTFSACASYTLCRLLALARMASMLSAWSPKALFVAAISVFSIVSRRPMSCSAFLYSLSPSTLTLVLMPSLLGMFSPHIRPCVSRARKAPVVSAGAKFQI